MLQGAIPPYSRPCVGMGTSESRCWKLIVLVWINACGLKSRLKAAISAGEVMRTGSWGWCQKEPSCAALTQICADYSAHLMTNWQDMSLHAHRRPLLSWFSGAMCEFLFIYQKQSWKEKGKLKAASVSATCQSGYNSPVIISYIFLGSCAASKAGHFQCSCIALQHIERLRSNPLEIHVNFVQYLQWRHVSQVSWSFKYSLRAHLSCLQNRRAKPISQGIYRSFIAQWDFLATICLLLNKDCTFCLFLHIVKEKATWASLFDKWPSQWVALGPVP